MRSNLLLHRVFIDHFNQISHDVIRTGLTGSISVRLCTRKSTNGTSPSKKRIALEVGSSGILAGLFDKTAIETVDADLRELEAKERTRLYRYVSSLKMRI